MMNREAYDRVTSILSPFSGIDKVDPLILSRAQQRGTKVHALCQGVIDDVKVDIPEEYKGYIDSFFQWFKDSTLFLPHPGRLYCDQKQITGEPDGIFTYEGIPTLFDFKTSVQENKSWKLQAAAYVYLMGPSVNQECHFVKLSKEGKEPKVFVYNSRQDIETFWKCLDMYRIFFKTKKPINEESL